MRTTITLLSLGSRQLNTSSEGLALFVPKYRSGSVTVMPCIVHAEVSTVTLDIASRCSGLNDKIASLNLWEDSGLPDKSGLRLFAWINDIGDSVKQQCW